MYPENTSDPLSKVALMITAECKFIDCIFTVMSDVESRKEGLIPHVERTGLQVYPKDSNSPLLENSLIFDIPDCPCKQGKKLESSRGEVPPVK